MIPYLIENTFPKYKILEYCSSDGKIIWAVGKRRWLFFYKPMTHIKSVCKYSGAGPYKEYISSSFEILMFESFEAAEDEIDRLKFGYPTITRRVWKDHKIVKEEYK